MKKSIVSIFDYRPSTLKENNKNLIHCEVDDRPVHLYFTREQDTQELDATEELMKKINSMSSRVIICTSWAELTEKLKLNPRSICFNYKELDYSSAVDIVNMVQTMSKLVNLPYEIKLCVDVGKDAPYETIKLLQKSDIQGIIPRPRDFGWAECLRGSEAIWAGVPYWPKHIIDQLSGNERKKKKTSEISLTFRQEQVFNLIKERGCSNKVIAKLLGIGESTVKLHMGAILKKYGAKNRTQLAIFSKNISEDTLVTV